MAAEADKDVTTEVRPVSIISSFHLLLIVLDLDYLACHQELISTLSFKNQKRYLDLDLDLDLD